MTFNKEGLKYNYSNTELSDLPLNSSQKRIWMLYNMDKQNPQYNIKLTYHLKGILNIELFQKSLQILFSTQNMIFSVFKQKNGTPYCEIIPRQVKAEYIDYSLYGPDQSINEIFTLIGNDSRIPFNIETGPLYRIYLLKSGGKDHFFHATVHHIVFDGWSRRVFIQGISKIYNSLVNGESVTAEPLIYAGSDFSDWGNNNLSEEREKEQTDFWKEYLKDVLPELSLPYDFQRKDSSNGFGRRVSFKINAEISSRLKEISRFNGSTLFEAMVAVIGVLLKKYSGENDICIGIPVSTRRKNPRLWRVFGLYINTVLVRLKPEGINTFNELTNYTKDVVRKADDNSLISFDKVVERLKPERSPGVNPFYNVSFSWFNSFTIPMDLVGAKGERFTVPEGIAVDDLSFFIWEEEGHKIGRAHV